MSHPAIPLVGANFARRTQTKEFNLGTPTLDNINQTWVYCHAAAAVATGTCTLTGFELTDAAGNYTADTAFAAGDYGWVRKTTSPL